jgi:hypothetical protein
MRGAPALFLPLYPPFTKPGHFATLRQSQHADGLMKKRQRGFIAQKTLCRFSASISI